MSSGFSDGTLASAAWMIVAARSSGRRSFRDPLKARPIGERAVETITASGIGFSSVGRVAGTLTLGLQGLCGEVLVRALGGGAAVADERDAPDQPGHAAGTRRRRALAAGQRLD